MYINIFFVQEIIKILNLSPQITISITKIVNFGYINKQTKYFHKTL